MFSTADIDVPENAEAFMGGESNQVIWREEFLYTAHVKRSKNMKYCTYKKNSRNKIHRKEKELKKLLRE